MSEIDFQLELTAFAEKMALAELEVVKAEERVAEIKYQSARYQMEWLKQVAKAQEPPMP